MIKSDIQYMKLAKDLGGVELSKGACCERSKSKNLEYDIIFLEKKTKNMWTNSSSCLFLVN